MGHEHSKRLPSHYPTVAEDMLEYAGRLSGVWLDLGAGSGGVGLALAGKIGGVVILVDPNPDALADGLETAQRSGLQDRVVAVVSPAESIPMPDCSVDVVVSRGSVFFWNDSSRGVREVYRVLRPGGKAMIGGSLGSQYPDWARHEFVRRRMEGESQGDPARARRFKAVRTPEAFHSMALEAGLESFEVVRDGGLPAEESPDGFGIWLRFSKGE